MKTNGSTKPVPMTRWDPWRELRALEERLGLTWPSFGAERTHWLPAVEMFEKDGVITVNAELPGLKREDIKVSVEQGDLVIEGERKQETERKEDEYYTCERSYGRFYRRVALPEDVDSARMDASFEDGVLKVTVPQMEKRPAQQIEVKAK